MELKFSGILIAVILVAFAEADSCGQEKSQECLDAYMSAAEEEKSDAEKCTDKREVARCLTEVAKECQGDDMNEDIGEAIEEMNQKLAEECKDDVDKCLDSNGATVLGGCLLKSVLEANDVMDSPEEFNMNEIICTVNNVFIECTKEQLTEKCGEGGGQLALEKLISIMPEDIRELHESCDSQKDSQEDSVQELLSVILPDQREERDLDYKKKREIPSPPAYRKKREIPSPPNYRKKREIPSPPNYRKKREIPSPPNYRKKRGIYSPPDYRKKREIPSPPNYRKKRGIFSPPAYRKKREIPSPPAYRKKREIQSPPEYRKKRNVFAPPAYNPAYREKREAPSPPSY